MRNGRDMNQPYHDMRCEPRADLTPSLKEALHAMLSVDPRKVKLLEEKTEAKESKKPGRDKERWTNRDRLT